MTETSEVGKELGETVSFGSEGMNVFPEETISYFQYVGKVKSEPVAECGKPPGKS